VNAVRWKTATFAGYQLRYAVAGSGPAVVLPKKDRGSYVPFERLTDQYTMVQIEPLGFGRSDRSDPYSPVTGQVVESAGSQGRPSASMTRVSKKWRPCLAAVDR
jgi:hypothetical protein